jgi:hypothetical protein
MRIFFRDEKGHRPVYGGASKFQTDPHWRDLILFYEYFHGDNGAGIGASHQTGWTGTIAMIVQMFAGYLKPEDLMNTKDADRIELGYERRNVESAPV